MKLPAVLTGRIRLVDALVAAAAALLLLKGVGVLLAPSSPELGPDGLPRFARVLAHARSNHAPVDPATTGSVPETPKAESADPPGDPPKSPARAASPSERAILERLGDRREELQQKAREIEAREKILEEAERRLDSRAGEPKGPEDKAAALSPTPAEAEVAASLKALVTMYETMKPKDAARVFDRLPHEVLVPVVRQVNPRKMAEIMAAMTPEGAEKLTVALARPSRGPEQRAGGATALPPGELPALEPQARPAPRR
ncbi:hypothetical protein [Enterovirga sp.]|uniref:MotE family protein n=1 Tax=Enterovirga sp. TaxID=2026350 RepID=UPI002620F364|nr:hypothetical protein [Enterovirga sp.]MDB5592191.1 hypothetical protein [Enterovirga sp.]